MKPDAFVIGLAQSLDTASVGNKARNLAVMRNAGHPVPDGFVLTNAALQTFLDESALRPLIAGLCARLDVRSPMGIRCAGETIAAQVAEAPVPGPVARALDEAINELGQGSLILRSSAIGEDSAESSFAGQLDSIGGVRGAGVARHALLRVWASQWSPRALSYQLARNARLPGMGVIVQKQIESAASGVLFTRAPEDPRRMYIEYCRGKGEPLVSGRLNPGRVAVSRDASSIARDASIDDDPATERLLDDDLVRRLAEAGLQIETLFGSPQDIEWTLDTAGRLWLVQARPITTGPARAGKSAPAHVHWSNANVNENFPRPVSPLLYSIARAGYYHYFRNLGRAFGTSKARLRAMDQPLRRLVGVHGGRMYYNLSSIHSVLRSAPFGELLTASFNDFIGAGGTATGAAVPRTRGTAAITQAGELCIIAVRTAWQYLFLSRRVARFEQTVSEFARRTSPPDLRSRTTTSLLDDFNAFLEIRNHRWKDAALADAAAMVCYGLLQRLLSRLAPAASQPSLHNNLLKALPGLVSGTPPVRLWELSQLARADERLERLFLNDSPAAILDALRSREQFGAFRQRLDEFLDEWGFRCSGELMLTMPSFQEEPERAIELIQAYLVTAAESPACILARQARERVKETRRLRKRLGWRWPAVGIVLHWTQTAILLRERARLKQALLYSRLRRIALAIGECLVEAERLEHADEIFWLTADEIDALLSGVAMFPNHVGALVRLRRDAHQELSSSRPPDTMTLAFGEYFGPAKGERYTQDPPRGGHGTSQGNELRGTGACGGKAEARAAVLDDIADAARLSSGDVLVTRQTDPGWGPVFPLISGLVIERGGMLSHGAIIAREFGIPSVVGVADATARIAHGARVRVDGDRGLVRILEGA